MNETLTNIFKGAGTIAKSFKEGFVGKAYDMQVPVVVSALEEVVIPKKQYTSEKTVEKIIVDHLNDKIGRAHSQYNISGYLGLVVDIDLGNGQVGVELKLAKELIGNAGNIERLFGQVIYYSKRQYHDRLIVCIVGTEKEYSEVIKEIEKFITEIGVFFKYVKVK